MAHHSDTTGPWRYNLKNPKERGSPSFGRELRPNGDGSLFGPKAIVGNWSVLRDGPHLVLFWRKMILNFFFKIPSCTDSPRIFFGWVKGERRWAEVDERPHFGRVVLVPDEEGRPQATMLPGPKKNIRKYLTGFEDFVRNLETWLV